jgi:L-asparaginase II
MTAHPEMVSGEGRSDLELMQAGRGDWVAKIGAEGVQGIGVRGAGIGIAIKVADGNKRALRPVIVSVLQQLGLFDDQRRSALAHWVAPAVHNYRGLVTGRIMSAIVLDKGAAAA